jgi:mono/diheme cytochrome c family protein
MMRISRIVILATAPLLAAALWMDKQPAYKPYQTPLLTTPAGSVPYSAQETVPPQAEQKNPFTPSPESLALGKTLFEINCAMCHGQTAVERGPVGKKLKPPPPGLDHDQVGKLSDSRIYNAITRGFGRMPPFQDRLSARERWDLVNYLRTRQ